MCKALKFWFSKYQLKIELYILFWFLNFLCNQTGPLSVIVLISLADMVSSFNSI